MVIEFPSSIYFIFTSLPDVLDKISIISFNFFSSGLQSKTKVAVSHLREGLVLTASNFSFKQRSIDSERQDFSSVVLYCSMHSLASVTSNSSTTVSNSLISVNEHSPSITYTTLDISLHSTSFAFRSELKRQMRDFRSIRGGDFCVIALDTLNIILASEALIELNSDDLLFRTGISTKNYIYFLLY